MTCKKVIGTSFFLFCTGRVRFSPDLWMGVAETRLGTATARAVAALAPR
jgi:hypothetical protein